MARRLQVQPYQAPQLGPFQVKAVGLPGQVTAGRQLTKQDFIDIGANVKGLWNLGSSGTTDQSGNGFHLGIPSGAVAPTDGIGINGSANTSSFFNGNAWYSATANISNPNLGLFQPYGSWGSWVRVAKQHVTHMIHAWVIADPGTATYQLYIDATTDQMYWVCGLDGTFNNYSRARTISSNIIDGNWHFVVTTWDGESPHIYVDGKEEAVVLDSAGSIIYGPMVPPGYTTTSTGGNGIYLGGRQGSNFPFFGWLDEAFITDTVLTVDQIRYLYCAKIPHKFGNQKNLNIEIDRRVKSGWYKHSDFTSKGYTPPYVGYNLSYSDWDTSLWWSHDPNTALGTPNLETKWGFGTAVNKSWSTGGGGNITGNRVDGQLNGGASFKVSTHSGGGSAFFAVDDTNFPAGIGPVVMACWYKAKSPPTAIQAVLGWGTIALFSGDFGLGINATTGAPSIRTANSAQLSAPVSVTDGNWHNIVVVYNGLDPTATYYKIYVDGKLSNSMTSFTISLTNTNTATGFRIGKTNFGTPLALDGMIASVAIDNLAWSPDQINEMYHKPGTVTLGTYSPKNPGDHIEKIDQNYIYCTFDTIEGQNFVTFTGT